MASLLIFCFALFVSCSTIHARDLFNEVEGKCKDVPVTAVYDDKKVATGEWYISHASFGNEGDKCASAHLVRRGVDNYIDLLYFDSIKNQYLNIPDDLTYHPDEVGVYSSKDGVICHKMSTDSQNYLYSHYCIEEEGKTQALTFFLTRDRVFDPKYEEIYNDTIAMLAEKKLIPKMHKIENTNCPPLDNVEQLSP